MKKLLLAALLSATVLSACAGQADEAADEPVSAGVEDFQIEGNWSGPDRERIQSTEGYSQGEATMEVLEAEGLTFIAEMTWATPDGDISERFVGAMTPDARVISGAGADGSVDFTAVDENTLDYCYTETGEDDYLTVCARLTRDE